MAKNMVDCPSNGRCGHKKHEAGGKALQRCYQVYGGPGHCSPSKSSIGSQRKFGARSATAVEADDPWDEERTPMPENMEIPLAHTIRSMRKRRDHVRSEIARTKDHSFTPHNLVRDDDTLTEAIEFLEKKPTAVELRHRANELEASIPDGMIAGRGTSALIDTYRGMARRYETHARANALEPSGHSVSSLADLRRTPVGTNITVIGHSGGDRITGAPGTVVASDSTGLTVRRRINNRMEESLMEFPKASDFRATKHGFKTGQSSDEKIQVEYRFTREGAR